MHLPWSAVFTLQHLLVAVVLVLSVGYALWRIWLAVKAANDPCHGCVGCPLKERRQRQRPQTGKHEKPECYRKNE